MSRPERAGDERPDGAQLLGRIVASRAGRDAGVRYVVVGVAGRDAVLVADGRRRGVDRPKKKNVRHLVVEPDGPAGLRLRLERGERVGDEDLRAALGPDAGDAGGV